VKRPELQPKPLRHFLDHGVAVIPTTDHGPTLGSWKDSGNFTTDPGVVANHWKNGIRRYQFLPQAAEFICFDLDRKNGKDGALELVHLFDEAGVVPPPYLASREPADWTDTFPAYSLTPSDGLHLYFRWAGREQYRSGELRPGLEVVHTGHLLTAPGSMKDGRPYLFFGSLQDAPALPPVVRGLLEPLKTTGTTRTAPVHWEYKTTHHRDMSLGDIAEAIDRQGEYSRGSSRNRWTYEVAKFARRKGYDPASVEGFVRELLEAPDFDAREISQTVRSAYGRG